MKKYLRILAVFALLLVTMSSAFGRVSAQSTTTDDAATVARLTGEAGQAVQDLLAAAAAKDYNTLYDSMHIDARALVPRATALNLFADVYSKANASQAVISSIEVGSYTWPVNGKTYPEAAHVTVVIPVTDANGQTSWIEDDWFLVKESGQWFWLLGTDQAFIDSINQTYAGDSTNTTAGSDPAANSQLITPIAGASTFDEFVYRVVNDLDSFYREVVGYTDYTYVSPGVVIVEPNDTFQTGCGPASPGFYAFYCPLDLTIYLDEEFLTKLINNGQTFAAAFVIAHEWAHHIQTGVGFDRSTSPGGWNQVYSIELELMADCFSGAWALDAINRGIISEDDVQDAINLIVYDLGDPKYIGEYDPQAHGNGEQRVRAFMNGYEQGFLGCNIKI